MSRSGYDGDVWGLELGRYRGQVASVIRGKRGQAFLRELIDALDALPEKRLIAHDLQSGSAVCAIGSVGLKRGLDMSHLDPGDYEQIAKAFGVAHQLVCEIEYMNDDCYWNLTPKKRWRRVREWAVKNLASAIDARSDATGTGAAEGESAVGNAETPNPDPQHPQTSGETI